MPVTAQAWMPYFLSTTAIVFSIFVAAWLHNKVVDTMNARIDETNRRIDELRAEIMPILREILTALRDLDRRVTRLEERSAPIMRS